MPRYFFDFRRNGLLEKDKEGTQLESSALALAEAIAAAKEIIADRVRSGVILDGDQFEVKAEDGKLLHILPLMSVLRLE